MKPLLLIICLALITSCITENRIKKYQVTHPDLCSSICPVAPPIYVHDTIHKIDTITNVIQPDTADLNNSIRFWQMVDSANCQSVVDSVKQWYLKHPVKVTKVRTDTFLIKAIQFVPDTALIRKAELKGYSEAENKYKHFDWWKLAWFVTAGLSLLVILFLLFRKK